MNTGFVFITIGTVTGVVWAFIEDGTDWILQSENRLLPVYLGLLSRHDFSARLGRLARAAHRLAGRQRAWLLPCHLGDARRVEEFLAG